MKNLKESGKITFVFYSLASRLHHPSINSQTNTHTPITL